MIGLETEKSKYAYSCDKLYTKYGRFVSMIVNNNNKK